MSDVRNDLDEVKVIDLFDNQTVASALGSDTNGPAYDRKDDEYPQGAKLVLDAQGDLGTGSDNLQFTLQHADDDGSGSPGSWSDTSETITIDNSNKRKVSGNLSLRGKKRHLRLQLDVSDQGQSLSADAEVSGEMIVSGMKVIPQ